MDSYFLWFVAGIIMGYIGLVLLNSLFPMKKTSDMLKEQLKIAQLKKQLAKYEKEHE